MHRHPFTTIADRLDRKLWVRIREIGHLVWDELAITVIQLSGENITRRRRTKSRSRCVD